MKRKLLTLVFTAFFALPAIADKPEWAGTGKPPTAQQKEQHRTAMQNKSGDKENKQSTYSTESGVEKEIEKNKEIIGQTKRWWEVFNL